MWGGFHQKTSWRIKLAFIKSNHTSIFHFVSCSALFFPFKLYQKNTTCRSIISQPVGGLLRGITVHSLAFDYLLGGSRGSVGNSSDVLRYKLQHRRKFRNPKNIFVRRSYKKQFKLVILCQLKTEFFPQWQLRESQLYNRRHYQILRQNISRKVSLRFVRVIILREVSVYFLGSLHWFLACGVTHWKTPSIITIIVMYTYVKCVYIILTIMPYFCANAPKAEMIFVLLFTFHYD